MPARKDGGKGAKAPPKKKPVPGFRSTPPGTGSGFRKTPPPPPKPARTSPAGDRPGDRASDLRKADDFKKTAPYRGASRDAYKSRSVKDRGAQLKTAKGPEGAAIRDLHGERKRADSALDALARWSKKRGNDMNGAPAEVLKGLRVQGAHAKGLGPTPGVVELADKLPGLSKKGPPKKLRAVAPVGKPAKIEREEKPKTEKGGIGDAFKNILHGLVPDPTGISGTAAGQARRFNGPIKLTTKQDDELRGTLDAATFALDQLNRPANAVGEALDAAHDGRNVGKALAKGFAKNDNAVWNEVADNAGLPAWAGLLGAIALDPTTYASFGLKTPAQAAKLKILQRTAREMRPVIKAAGEGDAAAQAQLAKMLAAREKEIKAATDGLEDTFRGVQVGVRNPFTGTVHGTRGRGTAATARQSAPRREAIRSSAVGRRVNKVAESVSPNVRPVGVSRADWKDLRDSGREANALDHRIAREGRQIGQRVVNVFGGDTAAVRQFVHRVEAGKLDGLEPKQRALADTIIDYHARVAKEYEDLVGKPIGMLDSLMLAPKDLQRAADSVREMLHGVAARAEGAAAKAEKTLSHAQGRAEVGSRTVDDAVGERAAVRAGKGKAAELDENGVDAVIRKSEGSRDSSREFRDGWSGTVYHGTSGEQHAKILEGGFDTAHAARAGRDTRNTTFFAHTPDGAKYGPNRIEAHVELKRPMVFWWDPDAPAETSWARKKGRKGAMRSDPPEAAALGWGNGDLAELAKKTGHDGAIYPRRDEMQVFDPAAIKSVKDYKPRSPKDAGYAAGGRGVEVAKAELTRQQAIAEGTRSLAARLADPKPLSVAEEEAFARLLDHVVKAAGPVGAERAGAKVNRLLERLAEDPVVNYIPREHDASLLESFKRGGDKGPRRVTSGEAQFEMARHDRRRLEAIRADGPEAEWTDQLGLLEAKYGIQLGHRLGRVKLDRSIRQRFGRPVTEADDAAIKSGELGVFKLEDDGRLTPVVRGEDYELDGHIVLPKFVTDKLKMRFKAADEGGELRRFYDEYLRTFKAMNTIFRPGFFATTIAGNFWQQFLRDMTPAEMMQSFGAVGRVRAADRAAVGKRVTPLQATLRKLMPETTLVDGRAMHWDELFDEAAEYGSARTGAVFGDPTDISLEREAARRIKGSPQSGAIARSAERLGQFAEDLDDMTRAILYRRARKDGMDPRDATAFTYGAMIDYTDLTKVERDVLKRVFPFYVYTARNLPIQVKRIAARPGKLANFEKLRDFLAQETGLPDDWALGLTEADQEKLPFPIPGTRDKKTGAAMFLEPRLPVSDIARPLQLLEGVEGAVRMGQAYAGSAGPLKIPFEVALNNRFDYNRPIRMDGYRPEAGKLQRLLQKLAGYDAPAQDTKSGKEYTATPATLDYLLRQLTGSPGSLILNAGRKLPDPSGVNPGGRALASFAGGFGVRKPDPLLAVKERIKGTSDKAYSQQKRDEALPERLGGGRGGPKAIGDQDRITEINTLLTKIKAMLGDKKAIDDLPRVRKKEMDRMFNPPMSPEYRSKMRAMDRALSGY